MLPSENNPISLTVFEDSVKGKIRIIKHSDDGTTQIETPEAGAEFEVYLKSSGSYSNAESHEKDYLVCDENGFAETKMLPYGVYVVHQTKTWENREMIEDFEVNVCKHENEYTYLINNQRDAGSISRFTLLVNLTELREFIFRSSLM